MANNSTNAGFSLWIEPFGLRVFRLAIFTTIILASLFGNSLVVKTVISLPKSRTPFSYKLVMNLALAELLNSILLPFLVAYEELHTWTFGCFLCHVISPLQILANSVITSTLAAIALSRCCVLVTPRCALILKKQHFIVPVILTLWFMAFALASPNFIFNRVIESLYVKEAFWCITLLPGDTPNTFPSVSFQAIILVQIVVNFLVNSAIMIVSYGIVIYKLRSSRIVAVYRGEEDSYMDTTVEINELQAQPSELHVQEKTQEPPNMYNEKKDESASVKSMESDLFKMFYAIIVIFISCYFPYQVMFILEYFGVVTLQWKYLVIMRKYLFVLTCLPSALHPLCYGLMTKFYAKGFAKIILCK